MAIAFDLAEFFLTNALLGTERQAFAFPQREDLLGRLLAQLDVSAPERALLDASALVSFYQVVGQRPTKEPVSFIAPAPPDSWLRCSPTAGFYLARILAGEYPELLLEWLGALNKSDQRAPEELIPALLEVGVSQREWRAAIVRAVGVRGVWLAAQNDKWDYATGNADPELIWQTGSREARLFALTELRAQNPTRARELAASTWNEDSPDDRVAFLGALTLNLSLDDEPFLEAALDDRRKEVRSAAADLLGRLPDSRLSQRMIARVKPLLAYKHSRLAGDKIEVMLPEHCDKAMQRDGIESKPSPVLPKMGERSWWLYQMLQVIPPSLWSNEWRKTPRDLLQLALQSEWKEMLFEGWIRAAQRSGDSAWVEAILELDPRRTGLVKHLAPARREIFISQRFKQLKAPDFEAGIQVLEDLDFDCGVQSTRAVMKWLREQIVNSTDVSDWQLRQALQDFAYHAQPTLFEEIESDWPKDAIGRKMGFEALDEFFDILGFRRGMLNAFKRNA